MLWLSTLAFTLLFNVWMMLGVLGIPIRKELGLSDAQLEWLIAAAILSGSVLRLNFGIWADVYGGRRVMSLLLLGAAIPTYLFSRADDLHAIADVHGAVRPRGQQLLGRHRVEFGLVSAARSRERRWEFLEQATSAPPGRSCWWRSCRAS